jgi:hypothetical protein
MATPAKLPPASRHPAPVFGKRPEAPTIAGSSSSLCSSSSLSLSLSLSLSPPHPPLSLYLFLMGCLSLTHLHLFPLQKLKIKVDISDATSFIDIDAAEQIGEIASTDPDVIASSVLANNGFLVDDGKEKEDEEEEDVEEDEEEEEEEKEAFSISQVLSTAHLLQDMLKSTPCVEWATADMHSCLRTITREAHNVLLGSQTQTKLDVFFQPQPAPVPTDSDEE